MSHITSRSPSNAASKAPTHVLSHLVLKKMNICMSTTSMMSTSIHTSTPMNILMTTITSILMKNILTTIIMIMRANTITTLT